MRLIEYAETRTALGGEVTLTLVTETGYDTAAVLQQLWRQTYEFERRFSRFLPDSELTVFNNAAGLKTVISPQFHDLLERVRELAAQTKGLFNPFILPALQRAGYTHSALPGYEDDASPDFRARSVVTPDKLELGDNWARIPYGTAIDVGGCGKGYLADQLGTVARDAGVRGYWMNLSGDIACYGVTGRNEQISVAIQPATDAADAFLAVMPEQPSGIATSGTFHRMSQRNLAGHHIIDPVGGRAAETDTLLATVCASTTVEADVLASCAVILGSSDVDTFLSEHGATSWHIQYRDTRGKVKTHSHGALIKQQHTEENHA